MKKHITQGIYALANAGSKNGGNWFVGHFGAEVLSLSFLLMDKHVSTELEPLVLQRITQCMETHSEFFEDVPGLESAEQAYYLDDYLKILESYIGDLWVDGHHTIYAALALRAFDVFPELATPEVITGLVQLLEACKRGGFDRYYGLDHRVFSEPEILAGFSYDSALEAARASLKLHKEVIADQEAEGQFYFFAGSRLHLVTHAQALLELELLGYEKLVAVGLEGFQKHCICIEYSKIPENAEVIRATETLDPRNAQFWLREKTNEHHGKLAYAVLSIFENSSAVDQQKALNDLSTYWQFYS